MEQHDPADWLEAFVKTNDFRSNQVAIGMAMPDHAVEQDPNLLFSTEPAPALDYHLMHSQLKLHARHLSKHEAKRWDYLVEARVSYYRLCERVQVLTRQMADARAYAMILWRENERVSAAAAVGGMALVRLLEERRATARAWRTNARDLAEIGRALVEAHARRETGCLHLSQIKQDLVRKDVQKLAFLTRYRMAAEMRRKKLAADKQSSDMRMINQRSKDAPSSITHDMARSVASSKNTAASPATNAGSEQTNQRVPSRAKVPTSKAAANRTPSGLAAAPNVTSKKRLPSTALDSATPEDPPQKRQRPALKLALPSNRLPRAPATGNPSALTPAAAGAARLSVQDSPLSIQTLASPSGQVFMPTASKATSTTAAGGISRKSLAPGAKSSRASPAAGRVKNIDGRGEAGKDQVRTTAKEVKRQKEAEEQVEREKRKMREGIREQAMMFERFMEQR